MHYIDSPSSDLVQPPLGTRWYHEVNRYQWFVLVVAALGWLFDTMDQQLFTLARVRAMSDLLGIPPGPKLDEAVGFWGGIATSVFMIGWATGGLAFGVLGDRIGRKKTMILTILVYSALTGLSAFAVGFWDFALYRFLTGLGIGGEFAVGVSLVAEAMPDRARPFALGLLQALSAIGNIMAAFISMGLGHLESIGAMRDRVLFGFPVVPWRVMFLIGILPAILVIFIQRRLKEPERWQAAASKDPTGERLGSYAELFGDPRWRRNALVGLMLAFSGVVGLWGIGFFSPDLTQMAFRTSFAQEIFDKLNRDGEAALSDKERAVVATLSAQERGQVLAKLEKTDREGPRSLTSQENRELKALMRKTLPKLNYPEINGRLTYWAGVALVMLNLGAALGIYAFSYISHFTGRKPAFAVSYILAMLSTALVFGYLDDFYEVFWMLPIMGFCQLALFGGYAIYFPELFPTRLRSTGISFCYNVGRYVAAAGPFTLGYLTKNVFAGQPEPMRYAGITMCSVFLIGLAALPFAPETKGKPLPE